MATIIAKATGNFSDGTNTWNGGVKPGANDVGDSNGYNVTLDEDVTCTRLQGTTGTFIAPASTARIINCNISTDRVATYLIDNVTNVGANLTINATTIAATDAGYAVQSNKTLVINATTITGVKSQPVNITGGAATITADWNNTASTWGYLYLQSGAGSVVTLNGNVTNSNNWNYSSGVMQISAGSLTFNGTVIGTLRKCTPFLAISGGTFTWTGARTINANTKLKIVQTGGTLAFAGLIITNNGLIDIYSQSGTITVDGTTAINNQSSAAHAVVDYSSQIIPINEATLPTAGNVRTGSGLFGWSREAPPQVRYCRGPGPLCRRR